MAGQGIGAGIAVVSGVVSTIAAYKKSKSDIANAKAEESLKVLEANELRRRATYNQELLATQLNNKFGDFRTSLASTAASSETKAILGGRLLSDISSELERAKSEADYAINMKMQEAALAGSQASAYNSLLPYQMASSLLGTGSDLYSVYKSK